MTGVHFCRSKIHCTRTVCTYSTFCSYKYCTCTGTVRTVVLVRVVDYFENFDCKARATPLIVNKLNGPDGEGHDRRAETPARLL
jgi:hypothetical protein